MPVAFFFSSRRRHTRSLCDWSSDVCSSDLRNVSKVRVQFNSATKRALRGRPVAFVINLNRGEGVVRFDQSIIKLERFLHGFLGERPMFRRKDSVGGGPGMIKA